MRRLQRVCWFCLLVGTVISIESSAEAQVVRDSWNHMTHKIGQTLRDYHWEKPFQYQPSDPFVRSKLYRLQTGHYGRFYNCDGEECKRESPYICWKVHHERDFPHVKRPGYYIAKDWGNVRQRIQDGSCRAQQPCGSCAGCTGVSGTVSDSGYVQQANAETDGVVTDVGDEAYALEFESEQVRYDNARSADVITEEIMSEEATGRSRIRPVSGLISRAKIGALRIGARVPRPLATPNQRK